MRGNRLSVRLSAALAIIAATLVASSSWVAAQETVLHSFNHNGTDGYSPTAGLIFDPAGNLYGTTTAGGTSGGCSATGCGTVFELSPNGNGGWTETVLYSFCSVTNCTDGGLPYAGLVRDAVGNLYGTTMQGGTHGQGTAFELTPNGSGGWTESVLHSFNNNGSDGYRPSGTLIFDAAGNLYGTTQYGGAGCSPGGCGTAFELSPGQGGGWTEQVLYSFAGGNGDGGLPEAALIFDTAGNLYGTTGEGGAVGPGGVAGGIVFELSPSQGGGWTEKVLYNFCSVSDPHRPLGGLSSPTRPPAGEFCLDGAEPDTNLIFDAAGNLYGTTLIGGYSVPCAYSGCGTVFELSPTAGGSWTEQVLYSFCPQTDCADGSTPTAGLIFDASGNLYSTTAYGGIGNCYGGHRPRSRRTGARSSR